MAILNTFHSNGMLHFNIGSIFMLFQVMFDIVNTKVTIKIKKDFCTVFPRSGLSHNLVRRKDSWKECDGEVGCCLGC